MRPKNSADSTALLVALNVLLLAGYATLVLAHIAKPSPLLFGLLVIGLIYNTFELWTSSRSDKEPNKPRSTARSQAKDRVVPVLARSVRNVDVSAELPDTAVPHDVPAKMVATGPSRNTLAQRLAEDVSLTAGSVSHSPFAFDDEVAPWTPEPSPVQAKRGSGSLVAQAIVEADSERIPGERVLDTSAPPPRLSAMLVEAGTRTDGLANPSGDQGDGVTEPGGSATEMATATMSASEQLHTESTGNDEVFRSTEIGVPASSETVNALQDQIDGLESQPSMLSKEALPPVDVEGPRFPDYREYASVDTEAALGSVVDVNSASDAVTVRLDEPSENVATDGAAQAQVIDPHNAEPVAPAQEAFIQKDEIPEISAGSTAAEAPLVSPLEPHRAQALPYAGGADEKGKTPSESLATTPASDAGVPRPHELEADSALASPAQPPSSALAHVITPALGAKRRLSNVDMVIASWQKRQTSENAPAVERSSTAVVPPASAVSPRDDAQVDHKLLLARLRRSQPKAGTESAQQTLRVSAARVTKAPEAAQRRSQDSTDQKGKQSGEPLSAARRPIRPVQRRDRVMFVWYGQHYLSPLEGRHPLRVARSLYEFMLEDLGEQGVQRGKSTGT